MAFQQIFKQLNQDFLQQNNCIFRRLTQFIKVHSVLSKLNLNQAQLEGLADLWADLAQIFFATVVLEPIVSQKASCYTVVVGGFLFTIAAIMSLIIRKSLNYAK